MSCVGSGGPSPDPPRRLSFVCLSSFGVVVVVVVPVLDVIMYVMRAAMREREMNLHRACASSPSSSSSYHAMQRSQLVRCGG